MSTFDSEAGIGFGPALSDEGVHAFFRAYLPDFYFVNTPLTRMRRHLTLIENLSQQPIQFDFYRTPGARFTELTLCAYDELQPGLLAKVAGTLSALKINVHTAWIHTLNDPMAPDSGQRVVLDTLILSETYFRRTRPLTFKTQKQITQVLSDVLGGLVDLNYLLSRSSWLGPAPIIVRDLSATPAGPYTLIKLCAADNIGLLYRVTRTLSRMRLDVRHAQINTFDKAVDDVFFVTNAAGQALPESEITPILENFRQTLTSGAD